MSGSGREALPDVQQSSGGPPEYIGVVGRPSRIVGSPTWMSGSGRVAHLDDRELSEDHLDVREWSEDPVECPGVVARSS